MSRQRMRRSWERQRRNLLHHSTTITIRGDSYRLKEKRRAGVFPLGEPALTAPG